MLIKRQAYMYGKYTEIKVVSIIFKSDWNFKCASFINFKRGEFKVQISCLGVFEFWCLHRVICGLPCHCWTKVNRRLFFFLFFYYLTYRIIYSCDWGSINLFDFGLSVPAKGSACDFRSMPKQTVDLKVVKKKITVKLTSLKLLLFGL